jgi:hypothetical protein
LGEVAFPTSLERDWLGFGGLSATSPNGPTLAAIGTQTLARAVGSVSSATVTLGALSMSGSGPPGGDSQALFGDEAVECAAVPAIWTLEFAGLENGDYEVLVYPPAAAATPTGDLFVEGISSPSLPGDPGLGLVQGTSYERFLRLVIDGTLSISGQDPFFQRLCIGVAGVQLERLPPAVPALSRAALEALLL